MVSTDVHHLGMLKETDRPAFWTTAELAARYKITEAQVRVMAQRHEIPALRVGKFWRFPVSRVLEWERAATLLG